LGGSSVCDSFSNGNAGAGTALKYGELNPVRAGLAEKPEDFAWSSAAAHRSGKDSTRILDMDF